MVIVRGIFFSFSRPIKYAYTSMHPYGMRTSYSTICTLTITSSSMSSTIQCNTIYERHNRSHKSNGKSNTTLRIGTFIKPITTSTTVPKVTASSVHRVIEDDCHNIRDDMISPTAWRVLLRLRSQGRLAYIVGGTVRDFLLGRHPKDYDILTSAEPQQVAKMFGRAFVLGKSFPICHVHIDGVIIEVSSFSTNTDPSKIPLDAATFTMGHREMETSGKRSGSGSSSRKKIRKNASFVDSNQKTACPTPADTKSMNTSTWAEARRCNALKRDFTVNGLLYDPFARVIYDYTGGVVDCQHQTLKTISDPISSFLQDPARMLRAVRLAARSCLTIHQETADAIAFLFGNVALLPQGRLQMELSSMMTHGASAASMKLMTWFGLIHIMLPHHASLMQNKKSRQLVDTAMTIIDEMASPSRPIEALVYVCALAAPLVAHECRKSAVRRVAALQNKNSKENTATHNPSSGDQYLKTYNKIVDKAIDRLLSPPKPSASSSTRLISSPARELIKKEKREEAVSNQIKEGCEKASMNVMNDDSSWSSSSSLPVVPCLLPRQAVETARTLFKIEAEIRASYSYRNNDPDDNPKSNEEIDADETMNNHVSSSCRRKAAAAQREHKNKRKHKRRSLSTNEDLVFRLLTDERMNWHQETNLGF